MYKETIPIFFTIDDKYASYNGIAVKSLIENASKEYKYKIIILYQDLSEKNAKKLAKLATENAEIDIVYMKENLKEITNRVENRLRCDYFTLSIYFRIFIADMFPQYDKGIYIDSDIVVPGDISELYNIELGDNIIAASTDHSIQEIPELMHYVENAVGVKRNEYINSGVLLMNLKLMREKKLSTNFLELLSKYHFDCVAPDQDYLNAMCNGKIVYLDKSWDAMPNNQKEELKEPKLIHYNLFAKPWCYDNIQYENYFWEYAKKTEFYDEVVEFKNNYSQEQKISDSTCLENLIEKAGKIPDTNEITFKKISDSGGKIRL